MFYIVTPSSNPKLTGFGEDGYSDSDAYGRVVAKIMKVKEDKKARDIKSKHTANLVVFGDPNTFHQFLSNPEKLDKVQKLTINMLRSGLSEDLRSFTLPKQGGYNYKIYPIANSYNNSDRECVYIAGRSGAGKSTWMSKYASSYLERYPPPPPLKRAGRSTNDSSDEDEEDDDESEPNIVIFSRVASDQAFNQKDSKGNPLVGYMDIDQIRGLPFDIEELSNKCAIFDDIDTLEGHTKKDIQEIRNDVLQTGRHKNITCLTSSHLMKGGNDTKIPIMESHKIVLFPGSARSHVIDMLKTYCEVHKNDVDRIMKCPSKWVTIQKEGIPYVYHEKGAFILD